ncbi:MAG: gamma-glutamyltransferase [bacterium]|nr:gamma-glutamyltransferase [bacterium]
MRSARGASRLVPAVVVLLATTVFLGSTLFLGSAPAIADQSAIYSAMDRVHPVYGTRGMVASQEAVASRIGLDVLKRGGNAVDAAVAVGFALAVTLPRAGNLGGGGFMLVHLAEGERTIAIDYREKAPAKAHRDMYLDAEGNVDVELSRRHPLAVAVPGTVAGMALALERYGTMSLTEVVAPAISLAEDGITVTPDLSVSLDALQERLKRWRSSREIFFKQGGAVYRPGEHLVQPDLAKSLRRIAEKGPDAFYRGRIAKRIVDSIESHGGVMTMKDMAAYEPAVREPVAGTYRGYTVVTMPPPSSGCHVIQILNILEDFPLRALGHNSAETIHLLAEAMKLAYADRSAYLGDPDAVDVPTERLLSKDYAARLRETISRDWAAPADQVMPGNVLPPESPETTHYSIIDSAGNVVSNTYTINFSYGSGLVAEGTGILLNNEMDDFSAAPGQPNAYGLLGAEANAIAPGKRPLSSMSPTIVFEGGKPFLVTGSPGGSRIITSTLQVITNVIDHGLNVAEASHAIRVHHQGFPDELRIEHGLSRDTVRLLESRGHAIVVKGAMGSTQSILVTGDGVLFGASDPRRAGALTIGY